MGFIDEAHWLVDHLEVNEDININPLKAPIVVEPTIQVKNDAYDDELMLYDHSLTKRTSPTW